MPIRGSIRFFVLVCLLLGLAGVFTMLLPKAAGASGKITVLGSTGMVNIRQGPGTNFPIVSKVARSSQLEYLVQRSGWYQVRLSSGQTGWVAGWLVRQAVPGKGQPAGSNSAPGGVLVVTGSVVNVRGGPGTGYAVTGRVVKGQQLEALEKKGEWYRVRLSSGQTGWVAGWLVRQAVPGKGQPAGSNSAPGGVLVVTGS
ncbi:MAG: SH3 domain-containing protein, partial [Bacillota bacterium]